MTSEMWKQLTKHRKKTFTVVLHEHKTKVYASITVRKRDVSVHTPFVQPLSDNAGGRLLHGTRWSREIGTKVDWVYYRDKLLIELLPDIRSIVDEVCRSLSFEDNATAYRPRQTVELLRRETQEFTASDMWPLSALTLSRLITAFEEWCRNEYTKPRQKTWQIRDRSNWPVAKETKCTKRSFQTAVTCFMIALNILSQWHLWHHLSCWNKTFEFPKAA